MVLVALGHGYNSQSAFTMMCKRYFGMPASAFYLEPLSNHAGKRPH